MVKRSSVRGKRTVRLRDFNDHQALATPQVSPDGRRVAYAVVSREEKTDAMRSRIWVADVAGGAAPRPVSAGPNDSMPRWAPNGDLAFVSQRGEDKDARPQVLLLRGDGGEAEALTETKEGVRGFSWSPDGTRIAYVERVREARKDKSAAARNAPRVITDLVYRADGVGMMDDARLQIFVLEVETRKARQLTRGNWHCTAPVWSPSGRQIAFLSDRVRKRFDRMPSPDVYIVDAKGGTPRKLTRSLGGAAQIAFSSDGRQIAFWGHERNDQPGSRPLDLFVVPVRGGAPRCLSASIDRPVRGRMGGSAFAWLPDRSELLFLVEDAGRSAIWRVSSRTGAKPPERVAAPRLRMDDLAVAADGKRLAVVGAWVDRAEAIYSAPLSAPSKLVRVTANPKIDQLALAPARSLKTRHEGLSIESFVVLPGGRPPAQPLPLYLSIHGGPHGAHPTTNLAGQVFAAHGYAFAMPNPRGSTGYGEAFADACIGDWGGGDFRDLMAVVDKLIERGIADPQRLFIGGYSYGGYMSSWALGQTTRFRAAAIGAPLVNLVSAYGNGDLITTLPEQMRAREPVFDLEAFLAHSPLTHVRAARTPALIQHWEGDLRCNIGQSEELYRALRAVGVESQLVRYPGGSHGGRTPSQDIEYSRRTLEWFHRFGGPRPKL